MYHIKLVLYRNFVDWPGFICKSQDEMKKEYPVVSDMSASDIW